MSNSSSRHANDSSTAITIEFAELVEYSSRILEHRAKTGQPSGRSPRTYSPAPAKHPDPSPPATFFSEPGFTGIYSGAAPLPPLRQRDWNVLDDWFQCEEMCEVETDITANLLLRFPELCWEDYVFDFLDEFLR